MIPSNWRPLSRAPLRVRLGTSTLSGWLGTPSASRPRPEKPVWVTTSGPTVTLISPGVTYVENSSGVFISRRYAARIAATLVTTNAERSSSSTAAQTDVCQQGRRISQSTPSRRTPTWRSCTMEMSLESRQAFSDSPAALYFTACESFCHRVKKKKDEQTDWRKQELSVGEVHQKVKEYNAQINSNLYMMALIRPITLPPPESPTEEEHQYGRRLTRRTSFYLPKDAAKHLHISSQTRVREVIEALLNKFTVVDNPAKFALFERSDRQNQVSMRKLSDDEHPLRLRLCAGPSEKVLSLVLKENETGEVNWDAFTFPELCNFLRILQREEEEHVRQIVRRYARTRDMMKQAMAKITAPA
ncbi:ras association domain-containing protein 1 isoform X2 [Syngnathus scovelli]|uniref:ras association domain-containing protein 1 isoform X2 n=1 Tax=Syngnathus scovelli TaxID=161590 RepID=UPI00210FB41C|nr:ras association domain-containing protein 1 isoform X2 [Syngnathus scovelli]